jgi:hypothetical protein
MSIAPKTIALIVGGLVVVGAALAAAPVIGEFFTSQLAGGAGSVSEPVEFPANEAGETYGSPIDGVVPKLIPARADDDVIGYVRVSELDLARNAAKSTTNPDAVFSVDVYESDGTTVIGMLTVLADTPGPRDGFNT